MCLYEVSDKSMIQSPSHTLCEKEQISKLKSLLWELRLFVNCLGVF